MSDFVATNLYLMERRRDALFTNALQSRIGQVVMIDDLANSLLPGLSAGTSYDTVFESVRYLAGHVLTEVEARRVAWRLAGNLERLRCGLSAPPWSSQQADEWVPLQVMKVLPDVNKRKKRGFTVTFRVLAGTPAPMMITTFWGMPACKFVSSKLGFSRPWGKYPFTRTAEFVGLRLYGKLDAAKSRTRPVFHDIECPPGMQKWNRENVLNIRLRRQPCPRNYQTPCHLCAIGYDQCAAATHPRTYTIGLCNKCGTSNALFDPADTTTTYCINCGRAERIERQAAK